MSSEVTVRITCDHRGCLAYRECRQAGATEDRERLRAINEGWRTFEGDDYCPRHAEDGPR